MSNTSSQRPLNCICSSLPLPGVGGKADHPVNGEEDTKSVAIVVYKERQGQSLEALVVLRVTEDAKPSELSAKELKLMRKSSTKSPTRSVSTRVSPWDGPAAVHASNYMVPGPKGLLVDSLCSHHHHPHSLHLTYSSLLDDSDLGSVWDTDFSDSDSDSDFDSDRERYVRHGLSLRAALEALRFHSRGYMKTPLPRKTPSSGPIALPPVAQMPSMAANPGTTVAIVSTPSPYFAPGMAQLAPQYASPYVNYDAAQLQATTSPASSYGALYASPYMTRSAPNLPQQIQTPPRAPAAQLTQGQSPYVTPYMSLSPPNQQGSTPIFPPPGLTVHPTPHHTPASGNAALLASTYASPYTQVQVLLPPLGAPFPLAAAIMNGTPYVRHTGHGTPYNSGTGKQLYPGGYY
ncbi:hypothetical protein K435DRAFT_805443 [Dendrothele bispora CBS 962.96]|uniref:Uncharacterized protein n=1 Tax=Dendrothele bispora (strain CBS 962.96) TaxID=1314807 RepID=A0A4S8LBH7_DENBC|nr:hypothetical protein K435DRAFT_805443 [Dendrothele bispora CBS 962.96]